MAALVLSALLLAFGAAAKPDVRCAACAHVTEILAAKLEAIKEELEVSRRVHEEAANKVRP